MVYTFLLALLVTGAVRAQTLELRQVGAADTGAIEIAVIAELADTRASGISFYVAIPEDAFAVIGAERPFAQGPLFGSGGGISQRDDGRGDWGAGGDGAIALCGGARAGVQSGGARGRGRSLALPCGHCGRGRWRYR